MSSDDESSDATLPLESNDRADERNNGEMMANNPNDEMYAVTDSLNIATPPRSSDGATPYQGVTALAGARLMSNNPNDEMVPVTEAEIIATPHKEERQTTQQGVSGHLDENRLSSGTEPEQQPGPNHHRHLAPNNSDDEEEDDDENEEEEDNEYRAQGYAGQKPDAMTTMEAETVEMKQLEYNPANYARVNAKAPQEIQDLFHHILEFQPFVAELPTKLRPFIPDYIPAIGDLDPFVKIPRPDGRPDGLGLYVVDEPAIPQSNPAVVQLELRASNVHAAAAVTVVDSFEDAANRPEVIDRWIEDLKKVHYKKPPPTVNYQKPMPEIENLMQVWPQSFEDVLNSDVQFPPPHIDLDIDQYVRTLCAILDIPTYQSLIEPLHVMFTLYEDFRFNQHFQHE